jgi:hypothetical protein
LKAFPVSLVLLSSINRFYPDFFTVGVSTHRIYEAGRQIPFYRSLFQGLGVLAQPALYGESKPP